MMPTTSNRKIAVFHHCRVSGGDPPISFPWAIGILSEQIISMRESGLTAAASEITFGVNGDESDTAAVASIAPTNAKVIQHPPDARGELPTLNLIWHWVRAHPGWLVYYQHIKAATHTSNVMYLAWMRCMTNVCVHNWKQCVRDLEAGFDMSGPHWLDAEHYSNIGLPFFGGNFWWSTSDHLAKLPEIQRTAVTHGDFYRAEVWPSEGPSLPRVQHYARHWPGAKCLELQN